MSHLLVHPTEPRRVKDLEQEAHRSLITDEMKLKVEGLWVKILHLNRSFGELTLIQKNKTTVFTINGIPKVIFKLGTKERFTNYLSALAMIQEKGYSSLVLPDTQLIKEENERVLIAEEALEYESTISQQEALWESDEEPFIQSIRELYDFIKSFGLCDIAHRNLFVLKGVQKHKIGIVDLEDIDRSKLSYALAGFPYDRNGLIKMIGRQALDIIAGELKEREKTETSFAIKERIIDLQKKAKLKKYHTERKTELKEPLREALKATLEDKNIISANERKKESDPNIETLASMLEKVVNYHLGNPNPADTFEAQRKVSIFLHPYQAIDLSIKDEMGRLIQLQSLEDPVTRTLWINLIGKNWVETQVIFSFTYHPADRSITIQA